MSAPDLDLADPIDVHVGKLLRAHRLAVGVTQQTLAEALGISFQQVQKYEAGVNRLSASKLYKATRILGLSPMALFEGLEMEGGSRLVDQFADFLSAPAAARMTAAFSRLTTTQQRLLADLAETMAP